MEGKMKKIVVWLSASSRVSWLQVWKQAFVAYFDMLMVRSNLSARSRKEGTQGAVAILRVKKGPRLCISKLRSNEFFSTESWRMRIERFDGTHHEILEMHLVQNYNSGKKKDNLEALSKKVNLVSEILARPFLRNEHLRKPHDKQIVTAKAAWNLAKNTMRSRSDLSSDKMDSLGMSRNPTTVFEPWLWRCK